MNIQWYPGHMFKAKKLVLENIKLVDLVIEIVDARLPLSSRNPDIYDIINRKPIITLLNKYDLSDPNINDLWIRWFAQRGENAVLVNCQNGQGIKNIPNIIRASLKDKIQKRKEKGMINKSIKLMVIGIPNVGKSSFINRFSGKASTRTGNKPGITKGKQWIRLKEGFELLDTPGILWPKFDDELVGERLAFSGAIKDEVIIDIEYLACKLLDFLKDNYKNLVVSKYELENIDDISGYEILKLIGRRRGCVLPGNEIDTLRIAKIVLDEFRNGRVGLISLEKPEDFKM
jgi:ribosome biogenesis GTPase A